MDTAVPGGTLSLVNVTQSSEFAATSPRYCKIMLINLLPRCLKETQLRYPYEKPCLFSSTASARHTSISTIDLRNDDLLTSPTGCVPLKTSIWKAASSHYVRSCFYFRWKYVEAIVASRGNGKCLLQAKRAVQQQTERMKLKVLSRRAQCLDQYRSMQTVRPVWLSAAAQNHT